MRNGVGEWKRCVKMGAVLAMMGGGGGGRVDHIGRMVYAVAVDGRWGNGLLCVVRCLIAG